MLGIDIKSLSSEKALACLYDRSEYIAFHLPVFLCRNEHEKERYLAEQADLLAGIEPWLLESLKSSIYMGIDYSEETQIYIFRKTTFLRNLFLKREDLRCGFIRSFRRISAFLIKTGSAF